MPKIAIVNDKDEIIGSAEKSDARKNGQIHRLVRILLCDDQDRVLLQKRHPKAKDSPNKWDFSVAGHVDEGEDYEVAATRELEEELGIKDVPLKPLFKFYAEKVMDGEHIRRFNMVFLGRINAEGVAPNTSELGGIEWFTKSQVETMIHNEPETFSSGLNENYARITHYLGG